MQFTRALVRLLTIYAFFSTGHCKQRNKPRKPESWIARPESRKKKIIKEKEEIAEVLDTVANGVKNAGPNFDTSEEAKRIGRVLTNSMGNPRVEGFTDEYTHILDGE